VLVQEIADDEEVAVRVVKVADTVRRRNSERGRQRRRSRGKWKRRRKSSIHMLGFFFCGGGSDIVVDRAFATIGKKCG